jgi:hypothetical protein
MFLASFVFMRRKFFCFLCYDPIRLTFVFDIRHPNWYIATRIRALGVGISIELDSRGLKSTHESKLRHCWP